MHRLQSVKIIACSSDQFTSLNSLSTTLYSIQVPAMNKFKKKKIVTWVHGACWKSGKFTWVPAYYRHAKRKFCKRGKMKLANSCTSLWEGEQQDKQYAQLFTELEFSDFVSYKHCSHALYCLVLAHNLISLLHSISMEPKF